MSDLSTVIERGAARFGLALPRGLARFLAVGVAGLATQTAVFTLLLYAGAGKSLAWFGGLAVATALTWALNRWLTFAASGRRGWSEALRYVVVTALAQSVSYLVFQAAFAFLPRLWPQIDVLMGAVAATAFSYTGQRFFTFAPPQSAPTSATAKSEPKA